MDAETKIAITAVATNSFTNAIYTSNRFLISENEVTNVDNEGVHLIPNVFILMQAILLFDSRIYLLNIERQIIVICSLAGSCCLLFTR